MAFEKTIMNICVFGLWHLGTVIAACMANKGFNVTGFDFDENIIMKLRDAQLPVYEPGLEEMVRSNLERGRLGFTSDPAVALKDADAVWVAFDTPVDDNDNADIEFVKKNIISIMEMIKDGTPIIISSQVPVGFTSSMKRLCASKFPARNFIFAYSPENLRLGNAIRVFENPDRIVIGIQKPEDRGCFEQIFLPISNRLEWMSIESAEMTKHAINAFLAASVVFANELAALCELTGADAREVAKGLKTDERIGPKAYLKPGSAYSGGTLARDINFLIGLGEQFKHNGYIFKAIKESNSCHKKWIQVKCKEYLTVLNNRKIAVLGLTYKPGTNTMRRSLAAEVCRCLKSEGGVIKAFDPYIKEIDDDFKKIVTLTQSTKDALDGAECIIIATEHPVFREIEKEFISGLKDTIVIDANCFLEGLFKENKNIRYVSVGRTS